MNTQQLECFTTLAKTLNYAKTAEQLSMSQPAVSRQIQSLETELGAQLFNLTLPSSLDRISPCSHGHLLSPAVQHRQKLCHLQIHLHGQGLCCHSFAMQ